MSCLTARVRWLWSCFFALSFSHPYVNSPWINDRLNNSNKMKDLKFFSYLSFLLTSREFNRLFQHVFLLVCHFSVCFAVASLTVASLMFHPKMDYYYTCTCSTISLLVSAEKSVTDSVKTWIELAVCIIWSHFYNRRKLTLREHCQLFGIHLEALLPSRNTQIITVEVSIESWCNT